MMTDVREVVQGSKDEEVQAHGVEEHEGAGKLVGEKEPGGAQCDLFCGGQVCIPPLLLPSTEVCEWVHPVIVQLLVMCRRRR